jgi:Tol biopolymer transport system component
MAQVFDPTTLELTGEPHPVAPLWGNSLTASSVGIIAYRAGSEIVNRLEWFDRTGRKIAEVGTPAVYRNPALAPDGQHLAVTRLDEAFDIWIFDLARGTSSRFTFDPGQDDAPLWSPDGSRLVFSRPTGVYEKNYTGTGAEKLLYQFSLPVSLTDWSSDGQYLLFDQVSSSTAQDLWVFPLMGTRKPVAIIQTPFAETQARFSADGRWLAYVSDEPGRPEVFVQTFPVSGNKWQVSFNTGVQPMWRADGKELFYLTLNGDVMAVPVATPANGAFEADTPQRLFQANPALLRGARSGWSVRADGQQFLIGNVPGETNVAPIIVVANWAPMLKNE